MKKKLLSLLMSLLLVAVLFPAAVQTAWAKDYDHILSYRVDVTPNVEDGSLAIRLDFRWEALEDLPAANSQQGGVKIGIPNGSIRELTALSGDIADIQNDNSYVYIDFTHDFRAGEVFSFSYSWVQEYMYTLDGSTVRYEYTPGWFDGMTRRVSPAPPPTAIPTAATMSSPPPTWATGKSCPWPLPTITGPRPWTASIARTTFPAAMIIPIMTMTAPPAAPSPPFSASSL
mgnify:CR=1 FL=1